MSKFIIIFYIALNTVVMLKAGPLQSWTFELIELTSGSSNTDILDLQLDIVRLGRGKYGFGGFIDFKVDLYDDLIVTITFARSKDRWGPYNKFPMGIENETLSSVMNKYYKYLLQPQTEKCCENAPIVREKFVEPLTKRYVRANNCALTTENLPNILMEGYYKMRLTFAGPLDLFVEALSLIETKIF